MELITQFINDLGNFIFIPVIFLVLMKILGRPLSECISSAIKVGIGFIALTMTIKLMLEKMQPAVTGLAEATGSSLSAIDVGGAATAVMGFGSSMGAIIIPLCVAVNIAMLVARLTDCVNVDVFNLHQNASMGAIVGVYSGSFLYGALTAALFHVWALIAADLGAKNNEKFFNLPKGVAISHPVANTYLLFAYPFNWIYDRIPGFRNLNVTAETIQKRFGILGDPTTVGFIIGILLGFVVMAGNPLPHHNCQPTVRDVSGCSHAFVATYDLYHDGRACSAFQRGTQKTGQTFPGSSNHCWNGHCPDCGSSVSYRPGIITDPGDCDPRSDLARQPRYATG